MDDLQRSQQAENQRLNRLRQEQQDFEEQKREVEKKRQEEKVRLEKKAFEDKKVDQLRSADESKRREDKNLDDRRRESTKSTTAREESPKGEPIGEDRDASKKLDSEKVELASDKPDAKLKSTTSAGQTPFAEPENKPSFATPKSEDSKLAKPTTLAERTAIRNMDKSIENERAGRTRPSAHTVERAEQAEAKLKQSNEATKTRKAEQHQSRTTEKTL